jgi:drug/metabolite transporter (DMT)-like permease
MTETSERSTTRTTRTPPALLPIAAIAVTVVLWASAFVAIRYVGREVSAGAMAFGRLAVASLLLGAFVLMGRIRTRTAAGAADRAWPSRRARLPLLICGVVWFGLYNIALNEAERRVDAGTAAMLIGIGPILIAVLAGLVLKEGLPAPVLVGCAVAFAGVVVIGASTSSAQATDWWGVVLCVVGAVAYAVGVVTQKPVLAEMSPLRVTWLACTIGLVVCLPFAPALVHDLRTAGVSSLAWLVYLGAMPTALAFTTWAYALARSTAGRLGATTYLVPPIAVLMGWLLLGERPATLAFVGGGLCLVGVYVSRRRR